METFEALHIFIALTLSENLLATGLTYLRHSDAEGSSFMNGKCIGNMEVDSIYEVEDPFLMTYNMR